MGFITMFNTNEYNKNGIKYEQIKTQCFTKIKIIWL